MKLTYLLANIFSTKLRTLSVRTRLTLQNQIQSMVTKERLKLLDPTHLSPSPMSSGASPHGGDSGDETISYDELIMELDSLYRN